MTDSEKQELINKLYTENLALKVQLNNSDYKVIKCAECKAVDLPLPYEIDELHNERQSFRDRINAIEDEIERLKLIEVEPDEHEDDIE